MELAFFHTILLVTVCSAAKLQHFGNVQEGLENEGDTMKKLLNISKRVLKTKEEESPTIQAVHYLTIFNSAGEANIVTAEEICLFAHNYVRSQHKDTPDLVWNAQLASESEAYAQQLAATANMDQASGGTFGNVYTGENNKGLMGTPADAVLQWYSESWDPSQDGVIKEFDYSFEPKDQKELVEAGVEHFTRLIWKGLKSVGCGMVTKTNIVNGYGVTKSFIVARYSPTGNQLQTFQENVQPLKSGESSLRGQLRVSELLPGEPGCKNTMLPVVCEILKNHDSCLDVAQFCNCQCNVL